MKNLDDLFYGACIIAFEHKFITTSFLQRSLRLGYNRACRLIKEMQREQLISKKDRTGIYGGYEILFKSLDEIKGKYDF